MARKTITVTTDTGRDAGKVFVIREMSASQAEKWAMRSFFAIAKSGKNAIKEALNFDFEGVDWQSRATIAEVAAIGMNIFGAMDYDLAEPLLDEMFSCVSIMPDPKTPSVVRALIDDDIEEISTRLFLRKEIFKLHVDFFTAAAA